MQGTTPPSTGNPGLRSFADSPELRLLLFHHLLDCCGNTRLSRSGYRRPYSFVIAFNNLSSSFCKLRGELNRLSHDLVLFLRHVAHYLSDGGCSLRCRA